MLFRYSSLKKMKITSYKLERDGYSLNLINVTYIK